MNRNDMQMYLRRILEQLARRQKMSPEIESLDEDLLNPGNTHDEIFDLFIKQEEMSLSETMASLKTIETNNGRLLIEGYKENYLNEIIQNINDLEIEINNEEDESIDITVEKQDGNYILCCSYRDDGFRAKDVYGFCNTGKGAKTEEQDGKFGIGIKALLATTSFFEVRSNLIIRYKGEEGSTSITENPDWDHKHTYTKYVIPVPDNSGTVNGIHVGKLENIIQTTRPEIVFGNIDYEELVFDFRSLLFMKRIHKINFNEWILYCREECGEEDESEPTDAEKCVDVIKVVSIRKKGCEDDYVSERYLCHTSAKQYLGKRDLAFLVDPVYRQVPNRVYSVYYIKPLMYTINPLGMLINTEHVNPFRNDVATTEEEINSIKLDIKVAVSETLYIWTEFVYDVPEISKAVSISFYRALLSYWDEIEDGSHYGDPDDNKNYKDFGIFSKVIEKRCTTGNLIKIPANNIISQKYVVNKHNPEEYEKYIPGIEDEDIVEKTKRIYYDTFEKGNILSFSQICENAISDEVAEVYKKVSASDSKELVHILNWFGSVGDYIKYVILNNNRVMDEISMEEVAVFIKEFQKEHNEADTAILHRILGRYKILSIFSETGRIRTEKINFIDYLFAEEDENEGILQEIFKFYDDKYQTIKKLLRSNRALLFYRVPYGPSLRKWDGLCATEIIPTALSDAFLDKEDVGLLLDIIDRQDLYRYIRCISEDIYLPAYYILNKYSRRRFKLQRTRYKNQSEYKLKLIDFLRIIRFSALGIDEFIRYQHVLDHIGGSEVDGTDKYMTGPIRIKVQDEKIHVNKLTELISWMTKWVNIGGRENSEALRQHINIDSIDISDSYNECGPDYIEFVNSITQGNIKDIYLRKLDTDNHGAKTIAYIGAGKRLNIRLKKGESFKQLYGVEIKNDDARLYVFYANQPKEQALSEVIDDLNLGPDITEQIKGYISVSEIGHSVSSHEYEHQLNWSGEFLNKIISDGKEISVQQAELTVRDKKKLFLARGSYDGCCPICGKTLIGENNDLDKAAGDSFLYTIKLDDGSFFQSCCCSACLAILRKTYMGAKLDGNVLVLKQTIVSGEQETSDSDIEIQLSKINLALKSINT